MNELITTKDEYIDPSDINIGLKKNPTIGKTLCELVVELVGIERDKVMAGGDTIQYAKIVIPLFNRFSKPAPIQQKTDALDELGREELEKIYNNLLNRKQMSDASSHQVTTLKVK